MNANSTANLLNQAVGVSVQESQPGGGSPNFRGMEANRLLVVIDGIALNNAIYRSGHVQNINTLNPFFIDNIRSVTGPASVVYGDGAMGGALIINTTNKESLAGNHNLLVQRYESANSSSSLKYINNFDKGKFSFINGFVIESTGNIRMGRNRVHGYENWGKESVITNNNEQLETNYNKYDILQKTFLELKEGGSLILNSQFSTSSNISRFDKLNDMINGERRYEKWYYGPQRRMSQSLNFSKNCNSIFATQYAVNIAWQNIKESRHKQKLNDLLISNRYESVDILDGVLDFKKERENFNINYGISYRKQHVNSTANLSSFENEINFNTTRYPDGGSEILDGAAYAQIKWDVLKKTSLFFGGRYNFNILSAKFNDTSAYSLPFSQLETKNKALVSSFLIKHVFSKTISTTLSYYMGFRNPNIDDMGKIFSKNDYAVVIPNENLKSEKSNNFEYVLLYKTKKIALEIQFFNTKIRDAIQRSNSTLNGQDSIIYDGEIMQVQMNQNIESAKINGLSIGSEVRLRKSILLDFTLNYLEGKNHFNLPLAHIPPLNSRINLSYKIKQHDFVISHVYNGWKKAEDYDDNGVDNLNEATLEGNPSWYILNFEYSNKLSSNINFSFSVENILDSHYKTFGSGISRKGRNFILSLKTNF
jgi:hemoglobin/transferrin/lactoferrin receptor protein